MRTPFRALLPNGPAANSLGIPIRACKLDP
jgi:hypothetical protein